MQIDTVIYHGKCSDGTMCRAIAQRFLKSRPVTYMEAFYTHDYTSLPPTLYGKSVLICDFSFKKEIFDEIVKYTKGNVYIIDHHKTAEADLKDVESKYKHFDMTKCGAYLVWKYFTSKAVPEAVLYVQDYDLWQFVLPDSKQINSYIKSLNFNVEKYESLLDGIPEDALRIGQSLVLAEENTVLNIGKQATPLLVKIQGRYYFVPHAFSHILKSEVGSFLLERYPYCSFSIVYSVDSWNRITKMSLRSSNEKEDVGSIAKLFGGGGHRNASGIEIKFPTDHIPADYIDDGRSYHLLSKITFHEGVATIPSSNEHLLSFLSQMRGGKKEIEYILGKDVKEILIEK